MGAVFISYRREDSEGQARALSLVLVTLMGKDAVFMDVDSIGLGRDFRQVLQERLGSCDLMFAMIGPDWLTVKDASGARRIDSPTDFVRLEVAAALRRDIPVIPVLLRGARVPSPDELPDDLKDLSYRNGFELSHSRWDSDVREMLTRLGLITLNAADSQPSPSGVAAPATRPAAARAGARLSVRRGIAAAILVTLAAAGVTSYLAWPGGESDQPFAVTSSPVTSSERAEANASRPTAAVVTPLPAPPSTPGGLAASGIDFVWPGGDCWDILRGTQLVTYQCGARSQALSAGRYTIKAKFAPVFAPFEVDIRAGAPTRVTKGGIFEFAWPGGDCWDIFNGAELVTFHCGTNKQALAAGRYTVKSKFAPLFAPMNVDVRDGSLTRVAMGGVFELAWSGGDCWDIFRGAELVTYHCGANKQALAAGRYTIKGKFASVFDPFDVTVSDGRTVVKKL